LNIYAKIENEFVEHIKEFKNLGNQNDLVGASTR
jgi:hypothetical protein